MQPDPILSLLRIGRWRNRSPVVAVVELRGLIGGIGPLRRGLMLQGVAPALERAFTLKRASAVAVIVNSPGGSPVQSALIARRIRALADEHKRPVFTFAEDVAASGGYWLLTAGDEIWAEESSIIGSIGVISAGFGFTDMLKRFGIERRVYTAGVHKGALDPFRPENPDDVDHLKSLQADVHRAFCRQVRERRGEKLKAGEDELFSGRFWSGSTALPLGLIDGIGDVRSVMRARFGNRVKLRRIENARRWWHRYLGVSASRSHTADLDRLPERLMAAVEERLYWARFGL